MNVTFLAFVRHEEHLLLLKRLASDADFPALWDGVYGSGEDDAAVLDAVVTATGIAAENLTILRYGDAVGIDIGGRFNDVTPVLVEATTNEVQPGGRYEYHEWIDPGTILDFNCVFSDYEREGSEKMFRELYGSVASFLYVVKTAIGAEERCVAEMTARLSGSGTLSDVKDEIFTILHPTGMRGYVMVEASAQHHVEKLIGRSGGINRASGVYLSTPLKNAKSVLDGEAPLKDILPYLEPKSVTSGIEVGCIVEITTGAFKGEKARITQVTDSREEVSMELYEQIIPMTLTMRGDHVRVIERVDD